MKDNVYIGARYVVSPEGEYDPLKEYESLSMVSYENSGVYVSRQPVPVNTPPTKGGSDSYWALMFPVDPQIKDFEKQLQDMAAQLNNAIADMREEIANNNQNVLDQIAAKFAQQDAAITKATTDVANFIDTANQTITEYTKTVDDFIAEYDPPAEAYGLLPQLVITANPSATVTAVQGTTVRSGTVPASGVLYLNLNAYGAWRVSASFQAQETSQSVTVDDVKQYTLNLTQAERQYKIAITNNSDLPIVEESLYQVTGPNGFSQTHNMSVTTVWECSVPVAGTYTVEAKIANLLPSKIRTSGATEYIPSSISGSIIYTTVDTTTATVTNDQETTSASLSIPKLTVTLPDASEYQEIQIQPPVVTEKSTNIYQNSDFAFIPWARGNWFMRNSTADFEVTETISSLEGYNGTVELIEGEIVPMPIWDMSISSDFLFNDGSTKSASPAQVAAAAKRYGEIFSNTIVPVAVSKQGKLLGAATTTNNSQEWVLMDSGESLASLDAVLCTYIPACKGTSSTRNGIRYVGLDTPDDNNCHRAFKLDNKVYRGIAIGENVLTSNGLATGGPNASLENNTNVIKTAPSTREIPGLQNAYYLNIDHISLILNLIVFLFDGGYVSNSNRILPKAVRQQYGAGSSNREGDFFADFIRNSIMLPQTSNSFITNGEPLPLPSSTVQTRYNNAFDRSWPLAANGGELITPNTYGPLPDGILPGYIPKSVPTGNLFSCLFCTTTGSMIPQGDICQFMNAVNNRTIQFQYPVFYIK